MLLLIITLSSLKNRGNIFPVLLPEKFKRTKGSDINNSRNVGGRSDSSEQGGKAA